MPFGGGTSPEQIDSAGQTRADSRTWPIEQILQIAAQLRRWSVADFALAVTTGGTGLSSRDRTPEATLAVLDYRVEGMEQAMRVAGLESTPLAMLSRGVVG